MNIAGIPAIGLGPGTRQALVGGVLSQNLTMVILVFAGLTLLCLAWRLCLGPRASRHY